MEQRKILIVTNRVPYPLNDGGNLAMQAMVDGYNKAGWQVYLLSMNTTRHYIPHDKLKTLFTNLFKFDWIDINNNIKYGALIRNFLFSRKPEHAIRFYQEDFRQKLKSVIENYKPDVVQIESVYLSTYLPLIKEISPAVTVLRMHNVEFQIWQGLSKKYRNGIKRFYFTSLTERIRNFERDAWKQYDLVLPITEKDAYQVSRLEEVNNMIVAPFSIDIEKIKHGKNEKWVGYHIGAMDWIPNREGVLWFIQRAMPKIRRSVPDFEFYFAGRKMPDDFKKLDAPGVHCLDEVKDADEFIADKKILIVPIWTGGGIRVKILEAMAAGKIVISTPSGIRGIEAHNNVHYLLARKPEQFEKAVKWCIDNKAEAQQMADNARQLIKEKYEQGKVIHDITEELYVLLGERRSKTIK